MKYIKGWVSPVGDLTKKVMITSKAHLPIKRKLSIACYIGAIGLSIYGIGYDFFKAGVEGHDIGECEALNELGLLGPNGSEETRVTSNPYNED
jgi:hypothetical protein